jgi:hypothetical protein
VNIETVTAALDCCYLNPFDEFIDQVPVLLDPGNGYVPYSLFGLYVAWDFVPGYGNATEFFPEVDECLPWFGVFLDAIGLWWCAHYPIHYTEGENILVPITCRNNPEIVSYVPWVHGVRGLSDDVLESVMLDYADRFAVAS